MRDFTVTPEPSGESQPPPAEGRRFVVQRHRATALHYDVRLELDGVLVSWAVPKGPTLDPKARRMAVHVEDHPLGYFDFEGVIPAGEYGGGDVIVWDWGTWEPADGKDPAKALAKGDLHVDLHGEKLAGRFVFVRRDDRKASRGKEQWLLLHKNDDHAVPGWDAEDHPRSVKTGRTNEQVKAAPEVLWHSDRGPGPKEIPTWEPPTDDELDALAAMEKQGTWELQGRELKVTNLDKVLFPGRDDEPPVTKRELIAYFATVGPHLLPYLHDRAVNLHRYPDGAGGKSFWQKEVPDHAPDWITRWRNPDADPGETTWYVVADSVPTLAWLANHGALELHPWTSPTDAHDQPSWALFDLDPGTSTDWDELLTLARLHRTALEHLGVSAIPKVSGRRGIQIWVPVGGHLSFDETRSWVEKVSRAVGQTVPDLVSWAWQKDERKGLARLDYTQNAVNKTLVAPFSTRPSAGAPVSVPITWDELDDPDLRPDRWTIRTVPTRLAVAGDPLRPLIGLEQPLPAL